MEVAQRDTEKNHSYRLLSNHRGKQETLRAMSDHMDAALEVFSSVSSLNQVCTCLLGGHLLSRHGNHLYEISPEDTLSFL